MELPKTLNINRTTYYSEQVIRDTRVTSSAQQVARNKGGIFINECSACGRPVASDYAYCPKCGRKFR